MPVSDVSMLTAWDYVLIVVFTVGFRFVIAVVDRGKTRRGSRDEAGQLRLYDETFYLFLAFGLGFALLVGLTWGYAQWATGAEPWALMPLTATLISMRPRWPRATA